MNGLSLRARLLAGVSLVAAVLAVVAIVLALSTRSQLIDQLDDRLIAAASNDRGDEFDRTPPGGRDTRDRGVAPAPPERQSDFYEGVISADGTLTTFYVPNVGGESLSPPAIAVDDIDLDTASKQISTIAAVEGDVDYRVLISTDGDGNGAYITALPLNAVEATIDRLVRIVLLGVAAALAVLALVTWWMLRLGIAPIKQMTTTASTIAAGDLSARADESSKAAESHELAVALNTMLGTIETSMAEQAESEARLRRFVSDASHELRTPVTTILGYAELYRAGGLDDPVRLDDAMRRTEQEAARMGRLVEDMLTLAKLDEHRPIAQLPVDIAAIASDVVADARVLAPARPITLDAPSVAMAAGDDDRLRQVLANVVRNAVVHTEDDVPIFVGVRAEPDAVLIEVRDEGAGMSPELVDRVTERFVRADPSRSRQQGGSGLGLSIAESAVAAHGGQLRVDSRLGAGTTVTITLPAVDAS